MFTAGIDAITNFSHARGDVVDLRTMGVTSFAQLQSMMAGSGGVTTIDFGAGNVLILAGLDPSQLQAIDFLLS